MMNNEEKKLETGDSDYIGDSKKAVLSETSSWSNILLYAIVIFVVVAIIWARFAILDEMTTGTGKVIPSSQIQVIQNLEGGILADINVKEGDSVEKNEVLLRIDDTRFASMFRENRKKYLALIASISRLQAEAMGEASVTFPQEVKTDSPQVVISETHLFDSKKEQLESQISTMQKTYDFAKHELEITKPLVEEGLMSKLELLRLQREVNDLEGKMDAERDKYRSNAREELNTKRGEMVSLHETLKALEDRMVRTTVRSPVKGTVKKVNIATLGGVIKPGMDILEIVPAEDTLLIEAKIKPSDIAFIHPGQDAVVKITAYDYSIYGGLDGIVEYISADTIVEETPRGEESYYKVNVRTNRNSLGTKEKPLEIIPGMTASVDVLTGKKSVLDYMMKPIFKAREKALRER